MGRSRRRFTAEQKAAILREHLIERVSVADLCDRHALQPAQFYRWQKEMMENLVGLLERRGRDSKAGALEAQIAALRAKLARKDAIIAEIMEDYVAVKKRVGRTEAIVGRAARARRRGGVRSSLHGADGPGGRASVAVDRDRPRQILPMAQSLRTR